LSLTKSSRDNSGAARRPRLENRGAGSSIIKMHRPKVVIHSNTRHPVLMRVTMKRLLAGPGRTRLGRLPLIALGMFALVCGVWGGLIRLPMALPLPTDHANWITFHGPLMVCGFLGTVIGLERAVGLRHGWTYAAPLLTGAGAFLLAIGLLGKPPVLLITAGSAVFAMVAWRVVLLQRALFTT